MRIKTVKKAPAAKAVVQKAAPCAVRRRARKSTAKAVKFTVHADKGKAVYVAGDFNGWDPTAKKMSFRKGVFVARMKLTPGEHQYKFVIDGTWCVDPENVNAVRNDQGTFNSVITVK